MTNRKDFIDLDKHSPDGTFTVPFWESELGEIDILSLREFAKEKGIPLDKLTMEQILQFKRELVYA